MPAVLRVSGVQFKIKMAAITRAEENDLEVFFSQTIPSVFRQAQRNFHSDNLNVLEYFERRLDDHAYVVRSVILQCEQQNDSEDFIHLLLMLHETINGLHRQFRESCNERRDYASEMGFSCPLENEEPRRPGRPRYEIPEEVIRGLHGIHGVWKEVAKEARVSYKTVLRRRHQYSMPVSNTAGPRIMYCDISQEQLCEIVEEVLQVMPDAGETYVIGALRSRGLRVQRWRIREAIFTVDPVSRALRRCKAIVRRKYNVPCPNALW